MSDSDKIRIWIGTELKTNLACKVLQHSILRNSKWADQIKFYTDPGLSWKNNPKLGVGTGFSLQRWYIPEKMGFEGYCIYLDADMLVFDDIVKLWSYTYQLAELPETSVACTYQADKWYKHAPATSVMVLDCSAARNWQYPTQATIERFLEADTARKRYIALMHAELISGKPLEIDINWNRFNKFVKGTKLLHYTIEPKQPWYSPGHENKDLWRDAFVLALKAGYISRDEVKIELDRYVAPSSCCRPEGLHPYWKKFIKN